MSATVLDLNSRLAHRPTIAQQAANRVSEKLHREGYPEAVIAPALARVASNLARGRTLDQTLRRVLAWARQQLPTLPPAA